MKKEKCVFDKTCRLYSAHAETYTSEELNVICDFKNFESFVFDVVVLYLTYVNKEDINCIAILNFVRNNCCVFGFHTIYSDRIILDLIRKFLEDK